MVAQVASLVLDLHAVDAFGAVSPDVVSPDVDSGSDWLKELLQAASPRWSLAELAAAKEKLRKVGAADGPRQLAELLEGGLNRRLRSCGLKAFTDGTSAALRSQLAERYGLLPQKKRERLQATDEAGAALPTLFTVLSEAQPLWTEKKLEAVEEKLAKVGVRDVRALGECLLIDLNQRIRDSGEKTLLKETMAALRKRFEDSDLRDYLKRPRRSILNKAASPDANGGHQPEQVLLSRVLAVDDANNSAVVEANSDWVDAFSVVSAFPPATVELAGREKARKKRSGKWKEALERRMRFEADAVDDKENQWRTESDFRRHLQNAPRELRNDEELMRRLCGCHRCSLGERRRDLSEDMNDRGSSPTVQRRKVKEAQEEQKKRQLQIEQAEVLRRRLLLVWEEHHSEGTREEGSGAGAGAEEGGNTAGVGEADPDAAAEAGAAVAAEVGAAVATTPLQPWRRSRSRPRLVLPLEADLWTPREWRLFLHGSSDSSGSNDASCPSRVSVVVPTTEARQSYHQQLWEIFDLQTWPDKELVVVETYRNEPSPVFAEKRQDERLVYVGIQIEIGVQDLTIGVKRNICTQLASGSYLAHFDDDDVYAPCYLTTMLQALVDYGSNASTLDSWYVLDQSAHKFGHFDPKGLKEQGKVKGSKASEWVMGFGFSYVYTREIALAIPFQSVSYKEDTSFYNQVSRHNRRRQLPDIIFLRDSVGICVHTLHGSSTSSTESDAGFYTEVPSEELLSLEVFKENSAMLAGPLSQETLLISAGASRSSRFIRGGSRTCAETLLTVNTSLGPLDVKVPVCATCAQVTQVVEKRLRHLGSYGVHFPCCEAFSPNSSSTVELLRRCWWPPRPQSERGGHEGALGAVVDEESGAEGEVEQQAPLERVGELQERSQTLDQEEAVGPHWAPWGGGELWAVLPCDRPMVVLIADLPDYAIDVQLRLPHNRGLRLRDVRETLLQHHNGFQATAAEDSIVAKARAKARSRAAEHLKLVSLTADGNFKDLDEDLEIGDMRLFFASFLAELLGRRRGPPYPAERLAGLCQRLHIPD